MYARARDREARKKKRNAIVAVVGTKRENNKKRQQATKGNSKKESRQVLSSTQVASSSLSKRGIIRRKTARSAPFRRELPFIMPPSRARAASLLFGTVLVCATTWAQVRLRENREEEKNNGDVSVGPLSHWKVPKDTFVVARCAGNTSIPLTSAEMGNAARSPACDLFFGSIRMGHANVRRRTRRKSRRRRRCLFQRASSPPVAALERCKRHALSPSGCRGTCSGAAPLCCRIVPLLNR